MIWIWACAACLVELFALVIVVAFFKGASGPGLEDK